jgi:hypothetical protein
MVRILCDMGRAPCASQSPARLYVLQGRSTAGPSHYRPLAIYFCRDANRISWSSRCDMVRPQTNAMRRREFITLLAAVWPLAARAAGRADAAHRRGHEHGYGRRTGSPLEWAEWRAFQTRGVQ